MRSSPAALRVWGSNILTVALRSKGRPDGEFGKPESLHGAEFIWQGAASTPSEAGVETRSVDPLGLSCGPQQHELPRHFEAHLHACAWKL